MAVIPKYERQLSTPIALNAPRQTLNAPVEAFGGAEAKVAGETGKGLELASRAMSQIALDQREKADSAAISAATKEYLDWDRDYTENTVYSVKGADATTELVKRTKDDRNAKIDELAGRMRSSEVGAALKEKLLSAYNTGQTLTARHIRSEMENWGKKSQAEAAQAQLDSLQDAAPSLAPEEIEAGFDTRVLPEIDRLAALTGTPAEELRRKTKETLFAGSIKLAIAGGDLGRANALMARWEKDIAADTRIELTASLRKKNIEDAADDSGRTLSKLVMAGKMSRSVAEDKIEAIEDDDLRRTTRRMFDSYYRQEKSDRTLALAEETVSAMDRLDALQGDLPAQQRLVESYKGDAKVKRQLTTRLGQYKQFGGIQALTDAEAFGEATDKILSGAITTPQQIDLDYAATISKRDRDQLKSGMGEAQKVVDNALKAALANAMGIEGGAKASIPVKKLGNFMQWARTMAKDTNRAMEPDYFQKLADMWVLTGETKGGFGLGYGSDATFGKSADNKTWLPDIISDKGNTNQMALTASTVEQIIATAGKPGGVPANTWAGYLQAANNDSKLAARMAWRDYLNKTVGKRGGK